MPIISASDSISLTPTSHRNNINDEAVTLIDTTRKVASVNNTPESLSFQLTNTVNVEANIDLWHKIKNYILPGRKGEAADEAELGKVLTEGQLLRQDIDNIAEQLRLRAEPQEPAFSLKTKVGWFIGTVLALAGSGVGLYRWRNPGNHHDNYSAKPDEIQKPSHVADNNFLDSGFQPCSYNKSEAKNRYRCSPPENSALKNSSSPPIPKNPLRNGLIKRETPLQFLSEISKPVDVEINNYQDTMRTIERWRNRLIGYVHAYIEVSEDIDNKYLAQQVLSLIAQNSLHESKIAHIYLYGTGLYGERIGESMSSDVERQLVGDLLAKLLYGQSLEYHLVDAFSKNRYISIKDFRNNIIESNFSFAESDSISQMKIFQDRYLIPCMPMLNLDLSYYSNIVVGSVTWFLIYLSSETEWIDAVKSREIDAAMNGLNVLNYFIAGNLTQGSKNKIHMGLKFTGLYFDYDATPQTLPGFQRLWNAFREALINYLSLSRAIVTKLEIINKNVKSIGDKPWASEYEFADYMLRKFCKKDNIQLFFIRKRGKYVMITKKEFIESVNEQAWCRIKHKNKRVDIKIPTIKYKYKGLINEVFSLISITSNFLIGNALKRSDYFNPQLDGDDYLFIEKSALEVVSIALNKVRSPQERLIGPPLTVVGVKEKYIFFQAIGNKERRLYAIDKTYEKLIQRVVIDTKNLQQSVGVFFDGWYPHTGHSLDLIVYRDRKINISISEQEPITLFVEKIVAYNIQVIKEITLKNDKKLSDQENSALEIIKELFIPLYSCVKALGGDDATDAFISCFLDGVFFIFPVVKKVITATGRSVEKIIDISFLIKNNESFRLDGSILWKKIVTDFHIYNTILNEQSMLRTSVIDLLLGSLDPGIGLMKEVRGITKNIALTIVKGGLIRLPLMSLKHFRNVAEFSVKAKSIIDSSKKIAVKVSKPSGRLNGHYDDENKETSFPSLYGSAYQLGDYYAYYSNIDEIDIILAITDETTSDEENIYVTLSEDEFNGVIFRCICKETELSLCNMAPIVTPELSAIKIITAISHKTMIDNKLIFKQTIPNQFDNLVFYPNHQCLLFEDGISTNKLYSIFKIGNVHYLFNPDKKQLRLLHDGDRVEVKKRDQTADSYSLNIDSEGNLVVRLERPKSDSTRSVFNVEYAFGGFFPVHENENQMTLIFISDKLLLNHRGRYFNLEMTTIRNQFSITDLRHLLPSFIVGWHSLEDNFIPAKPYLKKSSPHIGLTLEEIVDENCGYEGKLKKFPTLLLSGAVSAQFDMKLRVFNTYYPLGKPVNGLFPLECSGFLLPMFFWLYYDLLTESFELVSSQQSLVPPTNYTVPPYEELLSQMFSAEKFPDIAEIINLNEEQYNHKLTMRLRQAAFLQRLNPVDRLDTLQLPLVQVYSWELHPDVQKFQKKYPAAALWMTWQRQLHRLMKNKLLHELTLIKRMYLLNSENQKYTSGLLINSQYSYHESVWISANETEKYIIFHDANNQFYSQELDYEDDEIEWLPKAKYANKFPITQFMHEKNVLSKITINRKNKKVKIYDCYLGNVYLERYTAINEIEYFIMSDSGEWVASIDNKRQLLVYNLLEKNIMYSEDKQPAIYAKYNSTLHSRADQNYALYSLADTGVLYYPKNNLWVENNGARVLWRPPINYFPAFISEDQRFLGFKYKNKIDVIIYDQKRKLMALLKCPLSRQSDINITAVAFSALNAVVAVAFDDGHVYLYDLIRERKNAILNPIAHVKLQKIIGSESDNRVMMRFEGVFDTLTIIHPVALFTPYSRQKEIIYVRSSYGFHEDKR